MKAKEDWYLDKEDTAEDDQAGTKRGGMKKGAQKDGNRKKETKIETSTVMFIPSTRGGLLTRMMREREVELSKSRCRSLVEYNWQGYSALTWPRDSQVEGKTATHVR